MTAGNSKQTFTEAATDMTRSRNGPRIRPGHVNFGSHLDPYESLSARLRAEIDRRLREETPSK
ncbi:MAG: hypothetical protein IMF18_08750 [Proteobacteria bacterium]|nr:hypothetical protein [Pseudomonadota bacterium]